jgi:hypothetical protein
MAFRFTAPSRSFFVGQRTRSAPRINAAPSPIIESDVGANPPQAAVCAQSTFEHWDHDENMVEVSTPDFCASCLQNCDRRECILFRHSVRISRPRLDAAAATNVTITVLVVVNRVSHQGSRAEPEVRTQMSIRVYPLVKAADLAWLEPLSGSVCNVVTAQLLGDDPCPLLAIIDKFGPVCRYGFDSSRDDPTTSVLSAFAILGGTTTAPRPACRVLPMAMRLSVMHYALETFLLRGLLKMWAPSRHISHPTTVQGLRDLISDQCHWCRASIASKRCSGCALRRYCTRACQTAAWNTHKKECRVEQSK